KQARIRDGGRLVVDQLGLGRLDQGDFFQLGEEQRMPVAHGIRHTDAGELPAAEVALVGVLDNPLFIADQRVGTGGWGVGQLHSATLSELMRRRYSWATAR